MGKRHRSEREIRSILADAANGTSVQEIARRHGISRKTYYRWKARFEPSHPSGVERPRNTADENERLKRLVAEQALELHALKEILGRVRDRPGARTGIRVRSAPAPRRRT